MKHYSWEGEQLTLNVKVNTRASRTEIGPIEANRLRIHLNCLPVDGKANLALIKLVAKSFAVTKSNVSLLAGHRNSRKTLLIDSPQTLLPGIERNN